MNNFEEQISKTLGRRFDQRKTQMWEYIRNTDEITEVKKPILLRKKILVSCAAVFALSAVTLLSMILLKNNIFLKTDHPTSSSLSVIFNSTNPNSQKGFLCMSLSDKIPITSYETIEKEFNVKSLDKIKIPGDLKVNFEKSDQSSYLQYNNGISKQLFAMNLIYQSQSNPSKKVIVTFSKDNVYKHLIGLYYRGKTSAINNVVITLNQGEGYLNGWFSTNDVIIDVRGENIPKDEFIAMIESLVQSKL